LRHERTTFSCFIKARERLDEWGIERTRTRVEERTKKTRKTEKTNRDLETKNKDRKKKDNRG